jgi:hypothetical protein
LLLIFVLKRQPQRYWRSLRLGLIPFRAWLWVSSIAVFWLAAESSHLVLALGSLGVAGLAALGDALINRGWRSAGRIVPGLVESDLPVREGGEDLLGRGEIVEGLISTILLEQPEVIAVTGAYGEGKTSFLNLTVGKLRKLEGVDLPVIVRFSPWLAADSNALVLSLLNSIVVEIRGRFFVPGLGRDAARYARALLGAIPRAEWLKDIVGEPSQEQRITALARHIARTRRRVLVVLDDLDRMEARELETVLKLLRGSDRLSNITFLCAFAPVELALILKATRASQDTAVFIEKFFPVQVALPKIDSSERRFLLLQKINEIFVRYGLSPGDAMSKRLEKLWENGASLYFRNLRPIKLFLNRINQSLGRIADEVNIEDFIELELVHAIEPNLYEEIFRSPEYFWSRGLAFEASFRGPDRWDKDEKKERAAFYEKIKAAVAPDRQYVLQLVEDLFPDFGRHRERFRAEGVSAAEAEGTRRIFHPRCFRQYFLLKVPSELFSRKDFGSFVKSTRGQGEDGAAEAFNQVFGSIVNQEFKRWHFMHLIESELASFALDVRRGLCRGMAQNSALWQSDAFELLIAIGCSRETLQAITDSDGRKRLLRSIIQESASCLYALFLIRRIEYDLNSPLKEGERFRTLGFGPGDAGLAAGILSDLQEIKGFAIEHVRARYLGLEAPSVFEEFSGFGSGVNRIEPNMFLFHWQYLGREGQADEKRYLQDLFVRRPQDLNQFLKLMFRVPFIDGVPFIDDYTQLKPLIDYKELSDLITLHESLLDKDKVEQFRERYSRSEGETPPESPKEGGA